MKKSEGELLREYAKIIAEAEDQPDGFAAHEDPFAPSANDNRDDDENPEGDWSPGDLQVNDGEDEGEPEFNDIADNDDPISQLSDYLDGLDPHEMTFSEAIQKFLHEHNLELTPKNGLTNKQGAV